MLSVHVSAFKIPTRAPESDGTLAWDHTVLVAVELSAEGRTGIGYTYADRATAQLIADELAPIALAGDPMDVGATFLAMERAVRNLGRQGVAAMAISAVDISCWDLKAKLLEVSLIDLIGARRDAVPAYGSGGFITQSLPELAQDLRAWCELGMRWVKIKIGNERDMIDRVRAARDAIGPACGLFVDANGAYDRKQALRTAEALTAFDVRWFEEPVSSDDLEGLAFVRARAPAAMDIAAGEYGYEPRYFTNMLAASAVDVLQADATRCGGVTGFLRVADLCDTLGVSLSAHCAPTLHAPLGCVVPRIVHVECFYDHQRIEQRLFVGGLALRNGALCPLRKVRGMGFALDHRAAAPYLIFDQTISSPASQRRASR